MSKSICDVCYCYANDGYAQYDSNEIYDRVLLLSYLYIIQASD